MLGGGDQGAKDVTQQCCWGWGLAAGRGDCNRPELWILRQLLSLNPCFRCGGTLDMARMQIHLVGSWIFFYYSTKLKILHFLGRIIYVVYNRGVLWQLDRTADEHGWLHERGQGEHRVRRSGGPIFIVVVVVVIVIIVLSLLLMGLIFCTRL